MRRPLGASTLLKEHDNEDCACLQDVVRYLYHGGTDVRPTCILERLFPAGTALPTLFVDGVAHAGLDAVAAFLERSLDIEAGTLVPAAREFARANPRYRIGAG